MSVVFLSQSKMGYPVVVGEHFRAIFLTRSVVCALSMTHYHAPRPCTPRRTVPPLATFRLRSPCRKSTLPSPPASLLFCSKNHSTPPPPQRDRCILVVHATRSTNGLSTLNKPLASHPAHCSRRTGGWRLDRGYGRRVNEQIARQQHEHPSLPLPAAA